MVNFRKVFAMAVVMLSCASIQAQEQVERDSGGFSADLTVIPRLEGIQSFPLGSDASKDISWGNSSLYTLFEGNLNEHFSYSVCNHWLGDDPEWLYKNTLHSDNTNWVDWVNLTYAIGNFSITAGKDMVTMGGIEYDDYDFDVYTDLCSGLWQNYSCYQWGAKAALEVPGLNSTFAFQFSTSPFGEHPFDSKRFNYSLSWNGEYGPFRTIWSFTAVEDENRSLIPLACLGQSLELGSWTLGLDVFSQVGNEEYILSDGWTVLPSLRFDPGDHWSIFAKGGIETVTDSDKKVDDNWFAGMAAEWFPLSERNWRVHAACSYNHILDTVFVTLGTKINLTFSTR